MPRPEGAVDGIEWYCPKCYNLVHRAELDLESIVRDLPPVFERFYSHPDLRKCGNCGEIHPGKQPSK